MFLFFILLGVLSAACVVSALEPQDWPEQFTVSFSSNITTEVTAPVVIVPAIMWYDWTIQTQRIDHGAGAFECVKFYDTNEPCSLFLTPDGLYRVVDREEDHCCLDMPSIKASPPNWPSKGTDEGPTYMGEMKDTYSGLSSNKWSYITEGQTEEQAHHYYEVANKKKRGKDAKFDTYPLVFTFPVDDGTQDYHFDVETMQIGQPDQALFDLPKGCKGTPCASSSAALRAKKYNQEGYGNKR